MSRSELLSRIVLGLLEPLERRAPFAVETGAPRSADPVWQIGHAAFDAERALVIPPVPQERVQAGPGEDFHGRNSAKPWASTPPQFSEVEAWWKLILKAGEATLSHYPMSTPLPEPVEFTTYTVHTLEEAFDYVLYHTSFHLGRAWEIARIP